MARTALLLAASGSSFVACTTQTPVTASRSKENGPSPRDAAQQTKPVEHPAAPETSPAGGLAEETETVQAVTLAASSEDAPTVEAAGGKTLAKAEWQTPATGDGQHYTEGHPEAEATTLTIADFEKDADGFNGEIKRDAAGGKTGTASAKITNDGQNWVTAQKDLGTLRNDFQEVSFWIKSQESKGITLRLVDGSNQTHQQRPSFEPDGRWH